MSNLNYTVQSNKQKRSFAAAFIAFIAVIAILIGATIFIIANRNHDQQMELITIHSETPILKIYRVLDREMTIKEVTDAAAMISPEAEIRLYQDGRGEISIPGQDDVVRFYHNLGLIDSEENDTELTDEIEDADDIDMEEITVTEIVDYQPTSIVRDPEYLFFSGEAGYAIYYNADEDYYEVSDMGEVYQFSTKEEAIGSYLAPIVKE